MARPLCFLSQVRPLNPEGSLFLYGTEKVRLTYLRNPLAGERVYACLYLCEFVHLCTSVSLCTGWLGHVSTSPAP